MGEAADLLPRSGKFRNDWSYKTTPFISLHGAQSDNYTLYSNFRNKLIHICVCEHMCTRNFTFMLPCIVTDFFLNNQPDATIIPILFCYKTLHVSGIFSVHHQEFSTVHSTLVSFMQVSDDRFPAESG